MPFRLYEMALALLVAVLGVTYASPLGLEMAIANVTRYATGDLFSIAGTDCGPTRCMEVSHGTALAAMGFGGGCMCQCRGHKPAFREDQKICVSRIDECVMASFGKGVQPQIPFVFLPLKGQIIYPSNEIVFTEVQDAICAVTSAQYLSPSGWMTLRDLVDNDVPFGLYRDEGSTYLQWRGSAALHTRLEGRLVTAHVICSSATATQLATSCAAFRVAGASYNALLADVRSIPFHSGEAVASEPASQSQGLSVLESLAIGVCVLMLVFVYAAGIVFYIHYKKRQKKKEKDPELNLSNTLTTDNGSLNDTLDSRLNMDNIRMKSNPLLKLDIGNDFLSDAALSDVSERTEDTIDSSPTHKRQKFQKTNVSAVVHNYRKKPTRPRIRSTSTPERVNERFQRRSASPDTLERAPHSELSIVDCSVEDEPSDQPSLPSEGEPALRRKLYFNPVFFETEHLKHPPPAAIEFLTKIREVMSIAKDKMTTKRFIPILSDIPEEDFHHSIDLGWDIPCARRGRRFSAISLKRENSRRAIHCGGCPGCDSNDSREPKSTTLARSNSCKSCVSEDYKQKIVRKWLDEVPILPPMIKPMKSVAKVSGTPRNVEPKRKEENNQNLLTSVQNDNIENLNISHRITSDSYKINGQDIETVSKKENIHLQKTPTVISKTNNQTDNSMELITIQAAMTLKQEQSPTNRITRRVKKRLPPPPPPPFSPPDPPKITDEDFKLVPEDIKKKMEAVIRELNLCKRSEAEELERLRANCFSPKIVIPVVAADTPVYEKKESSNQKFLMDFDSLERGVQKKRRFSLATDQEIEKNDSNLQPISILSDRLSQSWRDMRKAVEINQLHAPTNSKHVSSDNEVINNVFNEIFITNFEPMYNNIPKPGPLTIEVRGSPVEARRNVNEEFDPDTLDRKPKREQKRVDKILLKSGGSFKHKVDANGNEFYRRSSPETLTQRIGSLRQIYEAKTKVQNNKILPYYERRGSLPLGSDELPPGFMRSLRTPDLLRRNKESKDPKPPVPPKQRRNSEISPKQRHITEVSPKFSNSTRESPAREQRRYSEDRDRFPAYSRTENLSTRRSSRRSVRTRSRRTDLRKLCKPEDSGYLSTDSNESKRRARYLMQMRPKSVMQSNSVPACPSPAPIKTVSLQLESDTDEMESLCDGRSESGGESIETDSVFFGNFDESKHMFAELCMNSFEAQKKLSRSQEQIDSGFVGDTNVVLSCDSDSEHRSVISIIAGRDGRASVASISQTDDPSY